MQCFVVFGEFRCDDVECAIFRFVSGACGMADNCAVSYEWAVYLKWIIGSGEFGSRLARAACGSEMVLLSKSLNVVCDTVVLEVSI